MYVVPNLSATTCKINSCYIMLVRFCYCCTSFNNSTCFLQTVANNPITFQIFWNMNDVTSKWAWKFFSNWNWRIAVTNLMIAFIPDTNLTWQMISLVFYQLTSLAFVLASKQLQHLNSTWFSLSLPFL